MSTTQQKLAESRRYVYYGILATGISTVFVGWTGYSILQASRDSRWERAKQQSDIFRDLKKNWVDHQHNPNISSINHNHQSMTYQDKLDQRRGYTYIINTTTNNNSSNKPISKSAAPVAHPTVPITDTAVVQHNGIQSNNPITNNNNDPSLHSQPNKIHETNDTKHVDSLVQSKQLLAKLSSVLPAHSPSDTTDTTTVPSTEHTMIDKQQTINDAVNQSITAPESVKPIITNTESIAPSHAEHNPSSQPHTLPLLYIAVLFIIGGSTR